MSSTGSSIHSVNSGNLRIDYGSNRLIVNDGHADVALFGVRNDGTIGYDLAPPGVDVKTATLAQLIASSRFDSFTIAGASTIDVTRGTSSNAVYKTVLTNISVPTFVAYAFKPSPVMGDPATAGFLRPVPDITYDPVAGAIYTRLVAMYDPTSTYITFGVESTTNNPRYSTAETWRFCYFLLYQTIPH